jgi:hypothetical protein
MSVLASSALAQTTSEYRVAVILVRFADTPQPAWGESRMAGSFRRVTADYLNYSYGRVRVVPDIYGWYTLDASAGTECPKAAMRDLGEAAVRAEAGARALNGYQALVFVTVGVNCGDTDGTATIGGDPAYVWIYNGNKDSVISHELAHAFGRPHSRSRACSTGGCTDHEYGDPYDRVGCGAPTEHFNAAQKEAQGWLAAPGFPSIRHVKDSGTYWIDAYEQPGGEDSVRALKVPALTQDSFGRNVFYYVESRRVGSHGRVLLHTASSGSDQPVSVSLVDLAPESPLFDGVLDKGQSFTDSVAGHVFTTLSSSATGSLVKVEFASKRTDHQTD